MGSRSARFTSVRSTETSVGCHSPEEAGDGVVSMNFRQVDRTLGVMI
jgi:hypothetical protein